MPAKSPMMTVLERFGTPPAADADRETRRKAKDSAKRSLVDTLADILDRKEGEEEKAFKERLFQVSNQKLLNLLNTHERVKNDYGSKENLVETILANGKRSKDEDYRKRLLSQSLGRLLTMAPKKPKEK